MSPLRRWEVVQALEKYAKTETGGYHGLKNVENTRSPVIDNMESFFLGETLKYLVSPPPQPPRDSHNA